MDLKAATDALAALAQETRLRAFRLLVAAGPEGLAAGEIARQLDVPANTLSTHLAILSNAGLAGSRRESRSILYAADYDGMRALLEYLVRDCCNGRPEACADLLNAIAPSACCPPAEPRSPS
ncbi:MAG: ArsR/SmtB family transcription factor [Alphaproteobacteria bacterium]